MSGHTYTHRHIHDNYYNPRCAHAHRGLINNYGHNCERSELYVRVGWRISLVYIYIYIYIYICIHG